LHIQAKKKKYYNLNSFKPYALNEVYSFGSNNCKKIKNKIKIKKRVYIFYMFDISMEVLDSKFQIEGDILFFT